MARGKGIPVFPQPNRQRYDPENEAEFRRMILEALSDLGSAVSAAGEASARPPGWPEFISGHSEGENAVVRVGHHNHQGDEKLEVWLRDQAEEIGLGSDYSESVLAGGPVLYLRMDGVNAEGLVLDSSGNELHGALDGEGEIARVAGLLPGSAFGMEFGVGDPEIVVPGGDHFDGSGYYIEFWIEVPETPASDQAILGFAGRLVLYVQAGGTIGVARRLQGQAMPGPGFISQWTYTPGQQHLIGCWVNMGANTTPSLSVYRDGELLASIVGPGGSLIESIDGQDFTVNFGAFEGKLDEVVVYTNVASSNSATSLHEAHWAARNGEETVQQAGQWFKAAEVDVVLASEQDVLIPIAAEEPPEEPEEPEEPEDPTIPTEGLFAWYDAGDLLETYADGATVATWPDKGPNGYDMTAVNTPALDVDAVNDLPAVIYESGDSHSRSSVPRPGDGTSISIFAVFKYPGGGNNSVLTWDGSASNRITLHTLWSGTLYFDFPNNSGGRINGSPPSGFQNNWHVMEWYRGAGTDGIYVDGALAVSGSMSGTLGSNPSTMYLMGGSSTAGYGHLAEIIIYESAQSPEVRAQVVAYLADKYGITLAS